MKFPRLFKKTKTGATQFWDIESEFDFQMENDEELEVGVIRTTYGQLNTDQPQVTSEIISKGKNEGKKNATTATEQAEAEAKSRWTKKKKSGYVESLESSKKGEVDEVIEGGILPMLAFTFEKQGDKIKYPCYIQPKLDGIRMIAILKNGKCTLWSRTRKEITSLPHIVEEIEKNFKEDIIFDGEAYNNDMKADFEKIVSIVRKKKPEPGYLNVQYHVYDLVNNQKFNERTKTLTHLFDTHKLSYLKLVETRVILEDRVSEIYNHFKSVGYEGAILRNVDGLYSNNRSSDLIKLKEMQDAEFKIVDIEEGRGKLSGHVGAFVCLTPEGKQFKAKMSGQTDKLKVYFKNRSMWENKMLTVQFQDLTADRIPRFPVGLRFFEET